MAFLLAVAMVVTGINVPAFAAAQEETVSEAVSAVADSVEAEQVTDEEPEVVGIVTPTNGSLVSALDGIQSDTAHFYAETTKKNSVKASWKKITDAKKYTLERMNQDGTKETLLTASSKKSYTDTTVYDDAKKDTYTSIYVLHAFDKNGSEIATYVTVPSSLITSVETGTTDQEAVVSFTAQRGPVSYVIQHSTNKKFPDSDTDEVDVDSTSENSVSKTYSDTSLELGTQHYFRVISVLDLTGFDVASNPSKSATLKCTIPAAEIVSICDGHDDGSVCYADGNVYVSLDNLDQETADKITKLQLVRSTGGAKDKVIKTEKLTKLTTTSLNGKECYIINYNKFYPEVEFSYKVRAIAGSTKGALSEPYVLTAHFAKVSPIDATAKDQSSITLSWAAENCAASYQIYRSTTTYDDEGLADTAGESAIQNENLDGYKKIGTLKNKVRKNNEAVTLSYVDKKGLAVAEYYSYIIVPVNKKASGIEVAAALSACPYPTSPTSVTVTSQGLNQMTITWNASTRASAYRVQRTKVSDTNGQPVWNDSNIDFDEIYSKGDTVFSSHKLIQKVGTGEDELEAGERYYYRVYAACADENKQDVWAETPSKDTEESTNYTKPYSVTKLTKTLEKCTTDDKIWYSKDSSDEYYNSVRLVISTASDRKKISYYEVERAVNPADPDNIDESAYSVYPEVITETGKYSGTYYYRITGLSYGSAYHFRVRPVYEENGKTIYGDWKTTVFSMPSSIAITPKKETSYDGSSSSDCYRVPKGETKKFYLDFDLNGSDEDATVVDYICEVNNSTYFTKTEGKDSKGYYVEITSSTDSTSTKTYFTVRAKYNKFKKTDGKTYRVTALTQTFYVCGD